MESEKKKVWWRDVLLIPFGIGIIIMLGTYLIPKIFEKGKELSYSIEGPITYINLDQLNMDNIVVEVNGGAVSQLYVYKVKLWNSGGSPLTNIPVKFVFEAGDIPNFIIFSVTHTTIPKYEFGDITEEGSDNYSKRFIYQLLNKDDEDTVTFFTNKPVNIEVHSKAEGTSIKKVDQKKYSSSTEYVGVIAGILAGIGAVGSSIVKFLIDKQMKNLQLRQKEVIERQRMLIDLVKKQKKEKKELKSKGERQKN